MRIQKGYEILKTEQIVFVLKKTGEYMTLKSSFSRCPSIISLKNVKLLNKEEWSENGDDFVMNVNIEFVFAFDKSKKIKMYRLEY